MTNLSTIDQIRAAFRRQNALATTIGVLVSGLAPILTFALIHFSIAQSATAWYLNPHSIMAAGLLAFSAVKVVGWLKGVVGGRAMAVCLTVGVEGFMSFAPANLFWLSCLCLAYLVVINAVAGACNLLADRTETRRNKRNARLGNEPANDAEPASRPTAIRRNRRAA